MLQTTSELVTSVNFMLQHTVPRLLDVAMTY